MGTKYIPSIKDQKASLRYHQNQKRAQQPLPKVKPAASAKTQPKTDSTTKPASSRGV